MSKIEYVVKRSGAKVPFLPLRITNAIYRAAIAVGGRDRETAEKLSQQVVSLLEETHTPGDPPQIEEIQNLVEKVLIENGHAKVAKAYILYREERARKRQENAISASKPSETRGSPSRNGRKIRQTRAHQRSRRRRTRQPFPDGAASSRGLPPDYWRSRWPV